MFFLYICKKNKNWEAWELVGYMEKRLNFLKSLGEENDAWKKGLVRSFKEFCIGKAQMRFEEKAG